MPSQIPPSGTDYSSDFSPTDSIIVPPHAAEVPLRLLLIVTGILLWVIIVVSVVGIVYGLLLGLLLFFAHLSLVVHIRGSSIKLGPRQMPDLYERVVALSRRVGLQRVPDAYLRQSGGLLNAFATRFGRANFVVLYSELVTGCGDNKDALDFIIAHELGHIKRGHLRWRWLFAPALFIPFLGSAYSRACEYTCDRFGFLASADRERGLDGLILLAAGPGHAARVNRQEFAAQANDLGTAMMVLGTWFASHPPLSRRISALDQTLAPVPQSTAMATVGAVLIAAVLVGTPFVGGVWIVKKAMEDMAQQMKALPAPSAGGAAAPYPSYRAPTPYRSDPWQNNR